MIVTGSYTSTTTITCFENLGHCYSGSSIEFVEWDPLKIVEPVPKPSPNGTGRDWSVNHYPALFGYRARDVRGGGREHTAAGRRAPWPVRRKRERRTRRERETR